MVTIEEMKRWKRTLGMTSKEISASSGVPLSTVQKIFSGVTRFPREATLAAILSVLEQKTVFVYDLEHENYYPDKYSFEDSILIRISGGECSIDFSRILRRIERYYLD